MKRLKIPKVNEKREIKIWICFIFYVTIDIAFDEMCCSYVTVELS